MLNTSVEKYHFLIVHGTKGSPDINWFPWLKAELGKEGHVVEVPPFPTPENQNFDAWYDVASEYLSKAVPEKTILIGHSTGSVFVLRLSELLKHSVRAVFSVCPFNRDLGIPEYDVLNASFTTQHNFDWQKVRSGTKDLFLYAGDSDPYVPLSYSQEIADALNVPLHIIKDGGHLNGEFGFMQFDQLLIDIKLSLR